MRTGIKIMNSSLIRWGFFSLMVSFFFTFPHLTVQAYEILMGTGESGSFSHFAGKNICRLISMDRELSCKTISAPDTTHNLTNLRSGSLDIALVDSQMLRDALTNSGYFKFLDINYDNLRSLATLYTVPIVLVARDDAKISTLDDVKGKRINAGAPLSLQHLAAETIMEAKGWTKKDFSLVENLPTNQSQETLAFSSGTTQAILHIGVHPDPMLQGLLKRTKAMLVDMDDSDIEKLVSEDAAFTKASIPAGTYTTTPEEVNTFGTQVILVTSKDLDDTTAGSILEAILKNKETLKKAHPSLLPVRASATSKLKGEIQPHPVVNR